MTRVMAIASLLSEPLTLAAGPRARSAAAPSDPTPTAGTARPLERDPGRRLRRSTGSPARSSCRRGARPAIARARQLAMYLARELTDLSLAEIARGFDRDHTTVLHAIRQVSSRLEPGSDTAVAVHRVRAALGKATGEDDPSTEAGHDPPLGQD